MPLLDLSRIRSLGNVEIADRGLCEPSLDDFDGRRMQVGAFAW